MNLSDRMKSEAVSLGLCAQWTAEWEDKSSKDAMVEKFVDGIDFCIKHDWPSCGIMKKYFGDVIHGHGVYVDESVHMRNPKMVVLNGVCDASISFDGFAVGTVYVRHKSKLRISVGGFAKVRVCLYDDGDVSSLMSGNGRCVVFKYGERSCVSGSCSTIDRTSFAKEHFG